MKKLSVVLGIVAALFAGIGSGCSDGKCDRCGVKGEYLYEVSGKEYCHDCDMDIKYACAGCGERQGYKNYKGKEYCWTCYDEKRLQDFDKEAKEKEIKGICDKYKAIQYLNVEYNMTKFAVPTTVKINGFEKLDVEQQFSLYDDLKAIKDLSITLISDNAEYEASTFYKGHYKKITKNGTIIYEYPGDPKETAYQDLTVYQKYVICQWIDGQYEAYDKMAGYDTGDKYTKDIFLAAADKYDKTYTQINIIWSELYDVKKALGLYNK